MTRFNRPARRVIVAAGVVAVASVFTLPAAAMNNNVANGVHTQFCQVNWSAGSVLKSDILTNPGAWSNFNSDNAGGYSNNGFLGAVGYDNGVLRVDHWFGPPVASTTPDPAPANTSLFWRIPVGTNWTVQNATAKVTLPTVSGNYNVSPASIAAWSFPSGYTGASPMPSVATPVSAGTQTFPLGTLNGKTGLFLNFNAPLATGWDRAQGVQASIAFTGTYIRGNPPGGTGTDTSPTCIYSTQASNESLGSIGPGGGTTPSSALGNDQGSDGKPAVAGVGGNVVLTPGPAPVAGMSMNPDGTVTVAPNTEPGVYSFTYKICPAQDPSPAPAPVPSTCSTASASITVTAPPAPVPTLGGWALVLLGGLLAGLGLRRRAA